LVYGKLTRAVKNYKTKVDFICRDPKVVQDYLDDELSGRTLTYDYAIELARGTLIAGLPDTIKNTPKELPIFIISGEKDPVGGKKCEEVTALHKAFEKAGCKNVELKIYKDARHELVNELNKEEVMNDILKWMENKS